MFGRTKEPTLLEKEIERVTRELSNHQVNTDEYDALVGQLAKLYKMKLEADASSVSKDTLILAGTNILGILLIIRHEHVNVITSRAMGMIRSPK
jgi:hypothetical protein